MQRVRGALQLRFVSRMRDASAGGARSALARPTLRASRLQKSAKRRANQLIAERRVPKISRAFASLCERRATHRAGEHGTRDDGNNGYVTRTEPREFRSSLRPTSRSHAAEEHETRMLTIKHLSTPDSNARSTRGSTGSRATAPRSTRGAVVIEACPLERTLHLVRTAIPVAALPVHVLATVGLTDLTVRAESVSPLRRRRELSPRTHPHGFERDASFDALDRAARPSPAAVRVGAPPARRKPMDPPTSGDYRAIPIQRVRHPSPHVARPTQRRTVPPRA